MRNYWIFAIILCYCVMSSPIGAAQVRDASAEDLIKQLEDKAVERRRDAAYELLRRGDHSDSVIAALGKASADDDTQVRVQSLTGLARAGKKSEPVIPELLKCLGNSDAQVRFRAAGALGAIGTAAIAPLTTHWTNASSDSKIAVAQAFAIIGPDANSAIPLMTEGLNGKDGLPRYAAEALAAITPQDEAMLLEIGDNPDAAARKVGISGLAALGSLSETAMLRLQKAASDSDPKIREMSIVVVAKSRVPSEKKSVLIEAALVDSAESVRAAAIVAMQKASLPVEAFSQRIATRLSTAEAGGANTIVRAIALLGPSARRTLPALVEVADRKDIDPQLLSQTFASFGAAAVPDLLAAIENHPAIEPVFSQALGLIGAPAVESLKLGIASKVELVRISATRALGGVRPLTKDLLQMLVIAAGDDSAQVREIAITSLIAAAKDADFAKETFLNASQDVEPKVRAAALQSLRSFKFTDEKIQEVVDRALQDDSPEVRSSAISVLSEMPKLLSSRLSQLSVLVRDANSTVRLRASQALGRLDKKQVNDWVLDACVTALRDDDHAVKIAATESVKSLNISDTVILEALGSNLVEDLELLRVTLETISGFGEKATSVIASVSQLASHEKAEVRVAALNALVAIEKTPELLVGRLTDALDDKEWEVRRSAGVALGKLGASSKNAVPKLFRLLSMDEDRDYAGSALKEINAAPVEAIPLLMEKLESEERRTAFYAVSLLGKIGPPAAEALPKLEAMLLKPSGDPGRSDFRKKFLVEAIAAIKGESKPK